MNTRQNRVSGLLLSAFLVLAAGFMCEVRAADTTNFDIPPGELSAALKTVAKQTGLELIFQPGDLKGLKTHGVKGSLSPREAVAKLIDGTRLTIKTDQAGAILITPARTSTQTSSLPAAMSLAQAEQTLRKADSAPGTDEGPATSEVVVTAQKIEGLAAMRVPTTLREIPQSVSVVDQETIQQQNAHSLADVLDRATGISVVRQDTMHTSFIARGFGVTKFHIDGGSPISLAGTVSLSPTDLSQFDHVEILRGADGLFGGNGNPGATVSMVRKRPGLNPAVTTTASIGSWDNYRFETDATGPLTSGGVLRGRAVVAADSGDFYFDIARTKRGKLYGILDYDLLPGTTTLSVGGSYERTDEVPTYGGLPRFADGSDPHLPRSTAFATPWGRSDARTWEGFVQLDHRFGDNWNVKLNGTYIDQSSDIKYLSLSSSINPVTRLMDGFAFASDGHNEGEQRSLDVTLTGSFEWLGRRHEVLVGADYGWTRNVNDSTGFLVYGPPVDPYAFDPGVYPPSDDPDDPDDGPYGPTLESYTIRQYGGYASVRFHPLDHLAVIGGLRDSAIKYSTPPTNDLQLHSNYVGKITPYAGVVYDLSKTYSIYASYADIFDGNANGYTGQDGVPLPPTNGINLEAGLKGAWVQGRLNGSLAVFKIDQTGVPFRVSVPGAVFPCCFTGASNKSRGAETELSGLLAPGWMMTAGYTYNRSNTNTRGAVLSTRTPKHLFKMWTSYQLPGDLRAWNVGGGLNAQSSNYVAGFGCTQYDAQGNCTGLSVPFNITQESYAVATLRVAYDINPQWSMALNVNNVMDRTYFQTIGNTTGANVYGEPRNFLLKLQGRF